MRIDSVEIRPMKQRQGTLTAFASCTLNDDEHHLKLASIAVHSDGSRAWITFPKLRTPKGEMFFCVSPDDQYTFESIESAIVKIFNEVMENGIYD